MKLTDAQQSPSATRYWRAGRGAAVVLIHGVGLDATMWQAQMPVLSERYEVIAYDMLGHGQSPLPPEDVTLDDYADQLARLLDELGLATVSVVGFSMGGLVARAFALRHPDRLRSMVILSSVFNRNEHQRAGVRQRLEQARTLGPSANVDQALERWFSSGFRAAYPECIAAVRDRVSSNDPEGYYRSYALFGTQDGFGVDRLASVRVPVLIATGELDPGSTPQMAYALAEHLPDARVQILDGQRHMAPVEAADQVNDLLLGFFREVHNRALHEETLG